MVSDSDTTKSKDSKCWLDVSLAAAVVAIVLVYCTANHFLQYYEGLTLQKEGWIFLVSLPFMMLYLPAWGLVFVLIVRGFIVNVKFGLKRLFFQILLVACSVYSFWLVPTMIETGYVVFTKGLLEAMKKEADIPAILTWLENLNLEANTGTNVEKSRWQLKEDEWPDEIRKLSPGYVIIKISNKGKRYVRVMCGGPLTGRWGLLVGSGVEGVPLNDYFVSEYRRELGPNAFVWFGLKR
jgi:hypothetical protein